MEHLLGTPNGDGEQMLFFVGCACAEVKEMPMVSETITSTHNEKIKRLKSLRERKYRQQLGLFLLEGEHCVTEALDSDARLRTLLVTLSQEARYEALVERAEARGIECLRVSESVMEALCDTRTPQGIAAAAEPVLREWKASDAAAVKPGILLILENIQDPGNLGTMIRTADAAGASGVLLSTDCADIHGPKVVRGTMGSLFHLPVWQSGDLPGAMRSLAGAGWAVLCGDLAGEGFYGRQIQAQGEALVIGNEGAGVTPALRDACTHRVRLPMAGRAESLNAAVAAGIMIYDIARRRGILEETSHGSEE